MYRILIVEDDPVITETLCAYMARWGLEARGVEDFKTYCASLSPSIPSWC